MVLVRARNPNNIGAVARAMHGFGFTDLRLVNEYSVRPRESALSRRCVLHPRGSPGVRNRRRCGGRLQPGGGHDSSRRTKTGTSVVHPGGSRRPYCALRLATARVALLFGSEKTGLSNDALSHCHWLMTIPMHPSPGLRHASMNLGQAAAVCLYELIRHADSAATAQTTADGERGGSGTGDRAC